MYTVYVIINPQNQTYIGQTSILSKRLEEHNQGLSVYTRKTGGPWRIIHSEEYSNRRDALKREHYLKNGAGHRWLKEKIGYNQTNIRGVA